MMLLKKNKALAISMGIFYNQVFYSELRKAKLVFILAAEDQEKHLKILQDILRLLGIPDFAQSAVACKSSVEAYYLIKDLLTRNDT